MGTFKNGISVRLNDKIKTHFENFPGEGKVLYMMDDLKEKMHFMFSRRRSQGKMDTIYIMKNPMMQNYLVERRQDIKEVQTHMKNDGSRRDEKLIQQFRERYPKDQVIREKEGFEYFNGSSSYDHDDHGRYDVLLCWTRSEYKF